ncbi:MAG: MaoC family dehydratase N-terminal domain-containing protein [Chloroflexi bacterium]|nr:MaoC family dehydratase N-terminal domain-containing protein [Chloroflexota bacterium]
MSLELHEDVFGDAQLAALRQRIGVSMRPHQQFNEVATRDAIRHYALGYGDTNPLFNDREYAQGTVWGRLIAPPTFLYSCHGYGNGAATVGLPGAHALWTQDEWEWERPVVVDDEIRYDDRLLSLDEVSGHFASRMFAQVGETRFLTAAGELIGVRRQTVRRFTRSPQEERARYKPIERQRYTDQEIEAIYADYDLEEIRGSTPRYWEDVQVGDDLPVVVKGPLTVTDIIAFKIGCGFQPFVRAHRVRVEYERRHPTTAVKNSDGVPDVPERVHWEDELARSIGVPAAFDYGYQRVAWLSQVMTNWIGDAGYLRRLTVQIRKPNLVSDTHWCRGRVLQTERAGEHHVVTCELWAENQRSVRTATATAVAVLPSRGTPGG